MAVTNFTPLLGLALPTTGDLSGTWGTTVNDAITDLLDDAVAGTVTLSADADVTLTTTNGVDNQARNAVILWTASNGATTRNVTAPAQSKAYIVINAGTGSVVIRGSGPTTGVTVTSGYKALVAWNGSDFVKIASTLVNLASEVTGTLPIANGGTGTTSTTFTNLTTNVTGTLPANNGGTGVANNAASTLTISGAFATTLTVSGTTGVTLPTTGTLSTLAGTESLSNKTLVAPALGTPASGTLSSCTVDGTNKVGYLNIPQSGSAKVASYTLVVSDVGKFVVLGTSGLVVVPASIFAVGDAISVANNTAAAITCTSSAVTAYLGGTNTIVTSFSLASRGVCTILYVTASVVFITGNVS
mgnify:CR=1 FL=1